MTDGGGGIGAFQVAQTGIVVLYPLCPPHTLDTLRWNQVDPCSLKTLSAALKLSYYYKYVLKKFNTTLKKTVSNNKMSVSRAP